MDVKPTALPLPLGAVLINTTMSTGPGSFYEAAKIIPILTEARDDSPTFHVVAPSLPNFGFSDGTCNQPGFGIKQYAEKPAIRLCKALGTPSMRHRVGTG